MRKIVTGSGLVRRTCASELCKAAREFQIYMTRSARLPLSALWCYPRGQMAHEIVGIVIMAVQPTPVDPLAIGEEIVRVGCSRFLRGTPATRS
jgi:hypothetical protein